MPPDFPSPKRPAQQSLGKDFLERDRSDQFRNQGDLTTMASKPIHHLTGIPNASAHQKEAHPVRRHCQGHFITGPSLLVPKQLIFVHHKKIRTKAFGNHVSLGFQSGHDDARIRTVTQIARD